MFPHGRRVGFYVNTFKNVSSLEAKFHKEIAVVSDGGCFPYGGQNIKEAEGVALTNAPSYKAPGAVVCYYSLHMRSAFC